MDYGDFDLELRTQHRPHQSSKIAQQRRHGCTSYLATHTKFKIVMDRVIKISLPAVLYQSENGIIQSDQYIEVYWYRKSGEVGFIPTGRPRKHPFHSDKL